MTVSELKKLIDKKNLPQTMVWVDHNHTLVEHYLNHLTLSLNRRLSKLFSAEEVISTVAYEIDPENVIYLLYLNKRELDKVKDKLTGSAIFIIMVDDEEIKIGGCEQILFENLSKNACILFLEDYVKIKKASSRGKKSEADDEPQTHISRELLERVVDYFDNNLDLCMNEVRKVEALELQGSWEKPFEAILNCLPPKDTKLRSLKWFSGGDVDTCQVLYNIYIKKLKTLITATLDEQEIWARLIRESIWCEACIVSGLIGDYVVDYLKLVESSLPGDFQIEYYPPVFHSQLKNSPEWGL